MEGSGVVVSEYEDEDAAQDYAASTEVHDVAHGAGRDRAMRRPLERKPRARKSAAGLGSHEKTVEDSPVTNNVMKDVAKDSFVRGRDTEALPDAQTIRVTITPPPTLKRKQRFPDSGDKHDKPASKKRKGLQKSDAATLLEGKRTTVEKTHHESSLPKPTEIPDVPAEENFGQTSTSLSRQQRREERRKRKEKKAERRRERAERKTGEIEMRDTAKLANPEEPTSPVPQDPASTVSEECEKPEEAPTEGDPQLQGSQDFLSDEDFTTPGMPSRRNRVHNLEIPTTQEPQTLSRSAKVIIPQLSMRREQRQTSELTQNQNIQSKGISARKRQASENQPNTQDTLEPGRETDLPIEPLVSQKRNAKPAKSSSRQHPVRPKANRRGQFLSAEKIVDSSEDEPQEPELHKSGEEAREERSNLRSTRRKVSDLNKLRTSVRFAERTSPPNSSIASEEEEEEEMGEARENKSRRQRRPFTTEDDEKLHRIIAQFKKVFAEACGF
jgi:hypothetical protein